MGLKYPLDGGIPGRSGYASGAATMIAMRVSLVGLLVAAALGIALPTAGWATQFPIRTYTTADGLPRNMAFCIVPDSRGFVWLCTTEGLARFDGKTFDLFGTEQGLPNRLVSEFLETKDGLMLVSTNQGVARMDPNAPPGSAHQFVPVLTKDGTPAKRVDELFQDSSGVVWAGTPGGIYRLENSSGSARLVFEKLQKAGASNTLMVGSFADDGAKGLWIGTNMGLCHRAANGHLAWTVGPWQSLGDPEVNALMLDRKAELWVGTFHGLWMAKQNTHSEYPEFHGYGPKDGLASERIHSLFQGADGTVWAGTSLGVAELPSSAHDAFHFRSYGSAEGLRGRTVFAINETHDGSLWAAVDHGLARISRSGFLRYSASDGMGELGITAFTEDMEGHLYALSNEFRGSKLHRFEAGRFRTIRPNYPAKLQGPGWGLEQVVLVDHTGEWWFATGEGLVRFPAVQADDLPRTKPLAFYTTKDGLASNAILRIFEDSVGRVWVSTQEGLSMWSRTSNSFHQFSRAEVSGYVSAFAEDHAGDVWIASSVDAGIGQQSKLFRFCHGKLQQITKPGTADSWVGTMYTDHAGRLWIGSNEDGLTIVDDPAAGQLKFTSYSTAQGLASFMVTAIAEDNSGRIYAATARGLDQINTATGRIQHYSVADGLPASPVAAMKRDGTGRLWIGTALGVASFQPPSESATFLAPVVFKTVLVNGKPRSISAYHAATLELNPEENQLQIQFATPSAHDNDWLRYEYKLNDSAAGWSQPSLERSVNYSNLPAGNYRFQVRSVMAGGPVGPASEMHFVITPHFWQRWWFIVLMAIGMAGLAFALHRYDLHRRLAIERVRTRIAADLHDDLGANLTRVVILSEVARRKSEDSDPEAGQRLDEIAQTARGLTDGMSDLVWSIDPRRDDIQSLLNRIREFASDVLEPQGIQWTLTAEESIISTLLTPDQRWQLFLIVKEAIHNAARHAHCSRVDISLGTEQKQYIIRISDDGCGLNLDAAASAGNGLTNMRKRASALNGQLEIISTPGQGAKIELRFPFQSSSRKRNLLQGA